MCAHTKTYSDILLYSKNIHSCHVCGIFLKILYPITIFITKIMSKYILYKRHYIIPYTIQQQQTHTPTNQLKQLTNL